VCKTSVRSTGIATSSTASVSVVTTDCDLTKHVPPDKEPVRALYFLYGATLYNFH